MLSNAQQLDAINVFLPFTISRDDIEDLGHLFQEARIATGIFNEGLAAQHSTNSRLIDLTRESDKQHYCRVFALNGTSNKIDDGYLKLQNSPDGTTIVLTEGALTQAFAGLGAGQKVYFRLRVNLPTAPNAFVRIIEPRDRWLLSGFESVEYTDFRLNEARNLPNSVEFAISNEVKVPILRLDFLLVIGVAADVTGGHKSFHKCRLLETELWSKYYGNGAGRQIPEGMVIYHWREQSPSNPNPAGIRDFSAFVKLRRRRSQVSAYIWIALLLGAVGGVGGNFIWWLLGAIFRAILGTSS